jgi:hypothetical protein
VEASGTFENYISGTVALVFIVFFIFMLASGQELDNVCSWSINAVNLNENISFSEPPNVKIANKNTFFSCNR